MFAIACIIGLFSYSILLVGLLGALTPFYVIPIILLFLFACLILINRQVKKKKSKLKRKSLFKYILSSSPLYTAVIVLIVIQGLINLIGVLGPELSFDALWYHLTLPKIYLLNNSVSYISGGLLYYSAMPQLGEMLYTVALMFSGEIVAKFIHFIFGVLIIVSVYLFSKRLFQKKYAAIAALIFYSNLVIGWESISANIDLVRAFFEVIAFWSFTNWIEKKNTKNLIMVGTMLGFAIATKLLALGSLLIFIILVFYVSLFLWKSPVRDMIKSQLFLLISTLVVASPWLIRSYLIAGNPVYPFFSSSDPVDPALVTFYPYDFLRNSWILLMQSADPITPIYIITMPLIIFYFKKFSNLGKMLIIYSLLGILISIPTAKLGGGRFVVAYLPILSISVGYLLSNLVKVKPIFYYKILIFSVLLTSLISIGYRGLANAKFIPVLIGQESKDTFLTKNLVFNFGDFYDTDGFFRKNITENDRVLLIGFHNLYYVNFPFVHESYLKEGDSFNYIAVQHSELPQEYNNWYLIYENKVTGVKLYKKGQYVALNKLETRN